MSRTNQALIINNYKIRAKGAIMALSLDIVNCEKRGGITATEADDLKEFARGLARKMKEFEEYTDKKFGVL